MRQIHFLTPKVGSLRKAKRQVIVDYCAAFQRSQGMNWACHKPEISIALGICAGVFIFPFVIVVNCDKCLLVIPLKSGLNSDNLSPPNSVTKSECFFAVSCVVFGIDG